MIQKKIHFPISGNRIFNLRNKEWIVKRCLIGSACDLTPTNFTILLWARITSVTYLITNIMENIGWYFVLVYCFVDMVMTPWILISVNGFYYLTSFGTKIQTSATKFKCPLYIDDNCNDFVNTLTYKILPYRTKIYLNVQKFTLTYKTIHKRR